jgi:hypothetical protein
LILSARAALRQGIIALMALLIAAPVMWLSGGTIMKMTAHAFDPFSPSSGVAAQPITQTVAKNSIMVMPLAMACIAGDPVRRHDWAGLPE